MPPNVAANPREWARRAETVLQRTLRRGADLWAGMRVRNGSCTTADFAGRRCHCPSDLPLHLLHSEALREACDFVVDFTTNVHAPGRPAVPVAALAGPARGLARGATVHVKTDRLGEFVASVLPTIPEPIVLVTGDSDASPVVRHAALLDHPRIAHWFVQNCDVAGSHPRLTRIPIGIDNPVYTKLDKRLGFAVTMALRRTPFDPTISRNDIGDQRALQRVRSGLPPTALRPVRALCTFHQNQKIIRADVTDIPDRADAWRILRENPSCHFVTRRLRQSECWAAHGSFAFEISPRGHGLDCFRTWEALLLGTIPIVKRSTLDPLFEDEALPVVRVSAWDEVTAEHLATWAAEYAGAFNGELERKLTADYWIAKIKKVSHAVRDAR